MAAGTLLALPGAAVAQPSRAVYPDDSVLAADVLVRARELAEAGNAGEAIRVLQQLLDTEGERMLATRPGSVLYLPVRQHFHNLLINEPVLLERYRAIEGPRAERMLAEGRIVEVESTRLLTAAGFEATLRRAQLEMEAARFESARIMLEQLEHHPDRRVADRRGRGMDAAKAMHALTAYIDRPEVGERAARWAREAGGEALAPIRTVSRPSVLERPVVTPLSEQAPLRRETLATMPLQSVPLLTAQVEPAPTRGGRLGLAARLAATAWIFPTIAGDKVLVNDGVRVHAYDRATLSPIWTSNLSLTGTQLRDAAAELQAQIPGAANGIEDIASVSVYGNTALVTTGMAIQGSRAGDRRVHALELESGRVLWSADLGWLDERLSESVVRGPAAIAGNVAVLSVRRPGAFRRVSSLYMAGLDLYTGELLWARLVGSVGSLPWGRISSRPEGPVLDRGIVYRGDEIGLVSAFEAATGRPVWVRVLPAAASFESQFKRGDTGVPAWAMLTPAIAGRSLFYLDPVGQVVRLDADTGELLGQRAAGELGEPRTLLVAGEHLIGVSATQVSSVALADFERGPVTLSEPVPMPGLVGRPVVSGDRLLVPTPGGLVELNAATLAETSRVDAGRLGNLLVGPEGDGGESGHLIVADAQAVHTYLSWDRAREVLQARIDRRPDDPDPLLTYARLAYGNGHTEMVPELADQALTVINASPMSERSANARHRLFELLFTIVRTSREGWSTPELSGVVRDLTLLDAIVERMGRAAEGATEQTNQLFELAWVRQMQLQYAAAVEAYQRILLDESLAAVEVHDGAPAPSLSEIAARRTARQVATDRLLHVLERAGPAPYRPFDEEAARLLEITPPTYEELAMLARRYPAAAASARAWRRAVDVAPTAEDARWALGQSVNTARANVRIGRDTMLPELGVLAGELVDRAAGGITVERYYRLVRSLGKEFPGLTVGDRPVGAVAATLDDAMKALPPRPRVGAQVEPRTRVIESWRPVRPLSSAGGSRDSIVLVSDLQKMVGLFATSAIDGDLLPVWTRDYEVEPAVIAVFADRVVLFNPTDDGGRIEAVSSIDGSTLWTTPGFDAMRNGDPTGDTDEQGQPVERFTTPLDGTVRAVDLVISATPERAILVQRSGRAVAIDLGTGAVAWSQRLPVDRVYEVELSGTRVFIGGVRVARDEVGRPRQTPVVAAFDVTNGALAGRMGQETIGDHPRWIRGLGDGTAIVATAEGVSRFDPDGQRVLWSLTGYPVRGSIAGWVGNPGLVLMDSELKLWLIDLTTGRRRDTALETRDKLTLPATGFAVGDAVAISSTLGVLAYGRDGELVGSDAIGQPGRILAPISGADSFVTIEAIQDTFASSDSDDLMQLRLFIMEAPSARIVGSARVLAPDVVRDIAILNGKILVASGPATIVIDAPVD